jgi:hypothetical protein
LKCCRQFHRKICFDVAEPFYFKWIDDEPRARILERKRKVDARIGRIVERVIRQA